LNATKPAPAGLPDFQAVFTEHGRFVWRLLARLGVQPRDVPDVCQEVFLVVHRRLPEYDASRGALRTWIYGICSHAASDYRRRHPSRRESSVEPMLDLASGERPDTALEGRRAWEQLARVLERMDDAKRLAFVLYELEALSMHEVASVMQCPLQTAYARLHAARRLVLSEFNGGEGP